MPDDFKPGPFWIRDEPLPPIAVVAAAPFATLVDELAPTLGASDAVLTPLMATIGTVNDAGIDAEYASTVDVAGAEVDAQRGAADDQTVPTLSDNGQPVDALRASVLPHLPGPDTPIPIDFTEPPGPPPPTAPPDDRRPPDGPPRQ